MASRPTVLFVGSGPIWRPEAGYLVRQRVFIDALSRFADVTLALFGLENETVPDEWAQRVVALPAPGTVRMTRWSRWWGDLTDRRPRTVRACATDASRRAVEALDPDRFDAVFAYRVDFAEWSGVLGRPGLLLDIDDPEALRIRRRYEATGEAIDARSERDLLKLMRYEKHAASQAAAAFVCQPGDREALGVSTVRVVPNVVHTPQAPPDRDEVAQTLLFIGNLGGGATAPNGDGLLWFVREIWPKVLASCGGAKLQVVGKTPPELATRLEGEPGVQRLGFVDDLGVVLDQAAASIVPIRYGTGTRIKALDAMARACPVVSTAMGCDGIESGERSGVLVADDPEGFASACIRMLSDTGAARQIGLAGYEAVRRHYDRAAQVLALAKDLEDTIAPRSRSESG